MLWLLRRIKNLIEEKQLLKRWNKLSNQSFKAVNPNYRLTWDFIGIRNNKPIYCCFCNVKMVIRNSQLDWSFELENLNLHIDLRFKCPNCDWWITKGVPIPKQYFLWLWHHRKKHGIGRTYAPYQEWLDNERIKQQLEALGYF